MHLNLRNISLTISVLAASMSVHAQTQTLKEVAQKAVLTNPEVLAKWHGFQSTSSGREAAFGAYLPTVNLSADAGRDNHENRLGKSEFNRSGATLSLNQMLYDGFLTSNQVKQLDHLKQVRLYEMVDASGNIALEAVRAYADIVRYRKLVGLSEDNYVRHRAVFEQIQAKAKAGVGRRVDLEQISGRLALSEANLLTETSNLHDVSARFQRLVGVMPSQNFENLTMLSQGLPSSVVTGLQNAFDKHPALLASIENIASVSSALNSRRSSLQPRLDLKAKSERGHNIDFTNGRTNNSSAEIVMSWNLFNGGTDKARIQESADQLNVARDLRDKTCRDIRQTFLIAFNDMHKLTDQLNYLDQHQLSIEKARDAYRQQFDIGQRSLLDLLDTENELFQAKRAFANAEIDLFFAYARTHAGMGNLPSILGLTIQSDDSKAQKRTPASVSSASDNCPIEAPDLYLVNKNNLNQRAMEGISHALEPLLPSTTLNSATSGTSTAPSLSTNTPTTIAVSGERAANSRTNILNFLKAWRDAWVSMNTDAYLGFYGKKYTSRESWKTARRARLLSAQRISLDLSNIHFVMQDAKHALTSFQQDYRSASYQDILQKTLYWEEIDGKWQIVDEVVSGPNAKQW